MPHFADHRHLRDNGVPTTPRCDQEVDSLWMKILNRLTFQTRRILPDSRGIVVAPKVYFPTCRICDNLSASHATIDSAIDDRETQKTEMALPSVTADSTTQIWDLCMHDPHGSPLEFPPADGSFIGLGSIGTPWWRFARYYGGRDIRKIIVACDEMLQGKKGHRGGKGHGVNLWMTLALRSQSCH